MGITLDTGALISWERRRFAMREVVSTAIRNGVPISVPTVVIAEWWRRGLREKERAAILRSVRVEALAAHVAQLAGVAIGLVPGAGTIDAIVMAFAALRGDAVSTSDLDALLALHDRVPELGDVQVLAV